MSSRAKRKQKNQQAVAVNAKTDKIESVVVEDRCIDVVLTGVNNDIAVIKLEDGKAVCIVDQLAEITRSSSSPFYEFRGEFVTLSNGSLEPTNSSEVAEYLMRNAKFEKLEKFKKVSVATDLPIKYVNILLKRQSSNLNLWRDSFLWRPFLLPIR